MKQDQKEIYNAEIGRELAIELVRNYWLHRHGQSGQNTENFSMYADLDLDRLIEYLLKMKFRHRASGLRLYYGAKSVLLDKATNEITYAITPVFVATNKGDKLDVELFTNDAGTEEGGFATGFDFGSLCPPDARHFQIPDHSIAFDIYGSMAAPAKKPGWEEIRK